MNLASWFRRYVNGGMIFSFLSGHFIELSNEELGKSVKHVYG